MGLSDVLKKFRKIDIDKLKRETGANQDDWREKKLFCPEASNVSAIVKDGVLGDYNPSDNRLFAIWQNIKHKMLSITECPSGYICIPLAGSELNGVEAVLSSLLTKQDGKVLILENGVRGRSYVQICQALHVSYHHVSFNEDKIIRPSVIDEIIGEDKSYHTIIISKCELASGLMNPVEDIGKIIKRVLPACVYVVDGCGCVGGEFTSVAEGSIDYLLTSSSGCLQSLPGVNLVMCREQHLKTTQGIGRSYSLNLWDHHTSRGDAEQHKREPVCDLPVYLALALHQALRELDREGGVEARAARCKTNMDTVTKSFKKFGFKELSPAMKKASFTNTFAVPQAPDFNLNTFLRKLEEHGFVLSHCRINEEEGLVVNTAGDLCYTDCLGLCRSVEETLGDMGVKTPLKDF